MQPPPWPSASASASAMARRLATHWIADALAGNESIETSVLQALLQASSDPLAGAPEATREQIAFRFLQELSSLIPAGGDVAATAGLLRVDGVRSCEDFLLRLAAEVEISGKLDEDLLPPFSQDIQETIRTNKHRLPETSFQLLKGLDPWITSQLEHHGIGQSGNDQTLQSASALCSISCNGANQGSKSETNLQPGTATGDRMAFEEQSADKSHLEVSGANKANQALHDDGSIMKNNMAHGGLTSQTAPVSQSCNVTLHDKSSEANCFSEQKNEKNGTNVQKDNCCTSIPSSSKDRDRESAKKTSNEEKSKDTFPEISVRSKEQDIDGSLEGLSQQDLCMICGQYGQLLTCSDCSLVAHDSCFGSSVTFGETNLFYCPVCFYKRARETYVKAKTSYDEAKKNVVAFIGKTQVSKEHDEKLNGVQPGAAKRDGHSNGSDMLKRNSIHQNEAYDLAHQDEEPHQQRKKQKINPRGNGYPKEVLTEKDPFQNSGPASMNKHSVLQNNSKKQIKDLEKKQQAGDKEARKEAGNDNSSHEAIASKRGCDPPLHQNNEADQEDSPTVSNQSGCKRFSPAPWRKMRHSKKQLQEKESEGIAKQDQHMATSPRNFFFVRPQKRYSKPVAPTGRRERLAWTQAEEAFLREAMGKLAQDGAPTPWTWILEYGHHVFHKTRVAGDLKSKWHNLMMKESAGY